MCCVCVCELVSVERVVPKGSPPSHVFSFESSSGSIPSSAFILGVITFGLPTSLGNFTSEVGFGVAGSLETGGVLAAGATGVADGGFFGAWFITTPLPLACTLQLGAKRTVIELLFVIWCKLPSS